MRHPSRTRPSSNWRRSPLVRHMKLSCELPGHLVTRFVIFNIIVAHGLHIYRVYPFAVDERLFMFRRRFYRNMRAVDGAYDVREPRHWMEWQFIVDTGQWETWCSGEQLWSMNWWQLPRRDWQTAATNHSCDRPSIGSCPKRRTGGQRAAAYRQERRDVGLSAAQGRRAQVPTVPPRPGA